VRFDAALSNPVTYDVGNRAQSSEPCGQGQYVYAAGEHLETVSKFCSDPNVRDKIVLHMALKRADEVTLTTAKIAEAVVDAYSTTLNGKPGDVGGPIDVLTVTKDGEIFWNARKPECPGNQK
jgi:hypothetical protein